MLMTSISAAGSVEKILRFASTTFSKPLTSTSQSRSCTLSEKHDDNEFGFFWFHKSKYVWAAASNWYDVIVPELSLRSAQLPSSEEFGCAFLFAVGTANFICQALDKILAFQSYQSQ
jgi:hypothetical protein